MSVDPATASAAAQRALADERRLAIVEQLRERRGGADVRELGEALGLHPNTVRWHLGILADAGLVESHSAGAHGPGRPRIVYTLSPAARRSGGDEHRLLAAILSGVVAGVPDAEARSEVAGYQWGRHVAAAAPGGAAAGGDAVDAVDAVSALLEVQGFEPEPEAERLAIRMRRCPFHDLAEAHPEVVCAVHRGFVTGALSELGSDLVVSGLDVFVEPDLCVLHLSRPRGTA
ncbi:MAG TPA: helix-turn-helix domain-containing protein [Gaiellaceae bacterium]|nr:helix-turn-helix domain-containing protein [Gaiellaceae bacterium]